VPLPQSPPPPNEAGAVEGFNTSRQLPRSSHRRLLQQNRHKADNPGARAFVRFWTKADKGRF